MIRDVDGRALHYACNASVTAVDRDRTRVTITSDLSVCDEGLMNLGAVTRVLQTCLY